MYKEGGFWNSKASVSKFNINFIKVFTAPSAHINTFIWPAAFIFLSYSSYDQEDVCIWPCSREWLFHPLSMQSSPSNPDNALFVSKCQNTHIHIVSVCTPTQKGLHCISTQLTDRETNSFRHFWLLIDTGPFCVHDLPDTIKWTEKNCMCGAITL